MVFTALSVQLFVSPVFSESFEDYRARTKKEKEARDKQKGSDDDDSGSGWGECIGNCLGELLKGMCQVVVERVAEDRCGSPSYTSRPTTPHEEFDPDADYQFMSFGSRARLFILENLMYSVDSWFSIDGSLVFIVISTSAELVLDRFTIGLGFDYNN